MLREIGEVQSESGDSPIPHLETAADVENMPGMAEDGTSELDPRTYAPAKETGKVWVKSDEINAGYRIEHSTRFQPGEVGFGVSHALSACSA